MRRSSAGQVTGAQTPSESVDAWPCSRIERAGSTPRSSGSRWQGVKPRLVDRDVELSSADSLYLHSCSLERGPTGARVIE